MAIFIGLWINPFDFHYRQFRYATIHTLIMNLIAPFCETRFKEILFGDALTSMVKPFIDFYFIACFVSNADDSSIL